MKVSEAGDRAARGSLNRNADACAGRGGAVELGVVIGKGGRDIPESEAMDHVAGYSKSAPFSTSY